MREKTPEDDQRSAAVDKKQKPILAMTSLFEFLAPTFYKCSIALGLIPTYKPRGNSS